MKKLFFAAVLIILLASCAKSPTAPGGAKSEDKNFFTSIRDAISKSITLKCLYVDEDGGKSDFYIKGNVLRVQGKIKINENQPETTVYEIAKDNMLYIWSDQSGDGLVVDLTQKRTEENAIKISGKVINSSDDIINVVEAQKQNCHAEVVADSMFEIPGNINFDSLTD